MPRGMEEARQRRGSLQGRCPQHQHVSFFISVRNNKLINSANLTVKGSKGLISTSDQAYTGLPADSRKPAAPIDPSSKYLDNMTAIDQADHSLQILLHLFCFGLRTTVSCSAGVHCLSVAEKGNSGNDACRLMEFPFPLNYPCQSPY